MKNFVEELTWRGMIHDLMPGTEELLQKEMVTAYVGIDPTADSLHIGHLVSVMMLKHLQLAGHKPIVLVGGATGMIGDPSGKSAERNLLTEDIINANVASLKKQLTKFLDFETKDNAAEIVNNFDWMGKFSFLEFIRDVGKHITVNYMMAKDSVKKRLETGLSFTEFSYQLVQGYDFLHLYQAKNCKLQMGGSDQWGNITTGTELIRRKTGGEAFALTCPLITKADGGKFGKTESGNVWLDPNLTSPYAFYQFWINVSDADAARYIRIFTLLSRSEIENLETEHALDPGRRILQKALAQELTTLIHSAEDLEIAINAGQLLFGSGNTETLKKLPEAIFVSVFEGVPQFELNLNELEEGISIIDLLAEKTTVFESKGEAKRTLIGNGVSLNKIKVGVDYSVSTSNLINKKYLLIQKGKKNYYLIIIK